jgi:hypothetical protein
MSFVSRSDFLFVVIVGSENDEKESGEECESGADVGEWFSAFHGCFPFHESTMTQCLCFIIIQKDGSVVSPSHPKVRHKRREASASLLLTLHP